MSTPPPFLDALQMSPTRKAVRNRIGCFFTRLVTCPLSIHMIRGKKQCGRPTVWGRLDCTELSPWIQRMSPIMFVTYLYIPSFFGWIWLIKNSYLMALFAQEFSDGNPQNGRCQWCISDNTKKPLEWWMVREFEVVGLSFKHFGDGSELKLEKYSA